jgi:C_GCAxxG_C_C family probable redox protein
MNKPDFAVTLFSQNYSCAQSILIAFADIVDLDEKVAFKIGAGLGGGIGRRQYICGAVNAGAIVLGLRFGNYTADDKEAKENFTDLVGKFVDECESKLGGSQCLELIKIDLNNDEHRQFATQYGYFERVCNNAVRQTSIILERYLELI